MNFKFKIRKRQGKFYPQMKTMHKDWINYIDINRNPVSFDSILECRNFILDKFKEFLDNNLDT